MYSSNPLVISSQVLVIVKAEYANTTKPTPPTRHIFIRLSMMTRVIITKLSIDLWHYVCQLQFKKVFENVPKAQRILDDELPNA